MEYLGINYEMKHSPKLDPTFIPFGVWRAAYLDGAKQPIAIAVERDQGQVSVHKTFIHGTPIGLFQGNDCYTEIPADLPKTTLINIDGKMVYVHRANVDIIPAELFGE